jgi:hypothetical protein
VLERHLPQHPLLCLGIKVIPGSDQAEGTDKIAAAIHVWGSRKKGGALAPELKLVGFQSKQLLHYK